jgi:RHS repeat-associated protein
VGNPLYVEFTHHSGQGNLYAYDKAYRLTSAQMGSADPSAEAADEDWSDYAYVQRLDFNMDDDSNRSSVVTTPYGQGSSTESYTSDNLNQYTVIASVSQTHDDNGNLTDDGVYDLAYDYRNNLIEVVSSSVVLSECEFDVLGRRSKQVTGDGAYTTLYFYDGEHVVEEFDGSDDLLRKFVYGQRIDEIRVMIAPDYADVDDDQNTTEVLHFYYHTDMLGTVTHITDESENVVESYEYTPYGETTIKDGSGSTISGSDILNPHMFTARRLDEDTGLYHYRRRAYDPRGGKFLQRDGADYADGVALHAYAKSCPTLFIDPMGEKSMSPQEFKAAREAINQLIKQTPNKVLLGILSGLGKAADLMRKLGTNGTILGMLVAVADAIRCVCEHHASMCDWACNCAADAAGSIAALAATVASGGPFNPASIAV